jgi:glycine/D-amino acid oxidase-like deaminating enzyme
MKPFSTPPERSYDVVIIGGAVMGSSLAFHLTRDPGFTGTICVIERDTSFAKTSTAHTNSCIRQQFSDPVNIRISQFGVEVLQNFRAYCGDERVPEIQHDTFGYLYLAADPARAETLSENARFQQSHGAGTLHLTAAEIAARWPFIETSDLVAGNWGSRNEGYFDGGTMFEWYRRLAAERGAHYVKGEVAGIETETGRVTAVTLSDGTRISAGAIVNATGPRAARIAAMIGRRMPVVPRKRWSFVFTAERPLPAALPLIIDPSGVHMRSDGPKAYLAGCPPSPDLDADPEDFDLDDAIWEDHIWPVLAARVPAFEAIRRVNQWVGHYAFNTLDQNAIIGPDPTFPNMLWMNGFSGHGFQQAAAMGRGLSEWIIHGAYRSIDLGQFAIDRVAENRPLVEKAII